MNPNDERYELLTEPDWRGRVEVKRVSDGKTAFAKASWFSPAPRGEDVLLVAAKSKTKANRMWQLDWK